MPVIDNTVEFEEPKLEKEIPANPMFEDMEEEETNENENSDLEFEVKFRSDKEKDYYSTLTEEEKEAWSGGWRGKMFRGLNKDGTAKPYKTASEFLNFQKEHTPVLNERNRKLNAQKSALEQEMAELRKQMNVMLNVQKIAYEEKTQSRVQSLDEAEESAILEGDVAKVRDIQKKRAELEKNKVFFEEPEVEQPRTQISPNEKVLFDNWAADNTWFYQDKTMQARATTFFGNLSERIPLEERLEMVSDEIELRFGDKLGVTKAPKVESGARGMSSRKQYTYGDLPKATRESCEQLAKKFNFNETQIKQMKDNAVKTYFN
jgi:hypothetical protein